MRLRSLCCVVLAVATASLALAGEETRKAPEPEPETAERWIAFSRAFEGQLFSEHRDIETIEEMMTQGFLQPGAAAPFARAAYWALVAGTDLPEVYLPGSTYYELTRRCVAMAIERGAGPDEEGKGADPRIPFVLGRLRMVDGTYSGDDALRAVAMMDAVRYLADALAADPVPGFDQEEIRPWYFRAAVNAAQSVLLEGDAKGCGKLLDAAQEHGRDHPDLTPTDRSFASIARAELHRALREYEESERHFRDVIAALPDSSRGYFGLGRVLLEQGKHEESLAVLEDALSRTKGRDASLRPDALLTAALALLRFSPPHLEQADGVLVEYFSLRPDHPDGLYVKGLIAVERGDWVGARKYFRWVLRRLPDHTQAMAQLVDVLAELGDEEGRREAAQMLEDARRRERERAAAKDGGTPQDELDQAPGEEPTEAPENDD